MRSGKHNDSEKSKNLKKALSFDKFTPKSFFKWLLILIVLLFILLAAYATFCIVTAPKIDTSKIYETLSETSVIYDQNNKRVDSVYSDQNRVSVKYEKLPKNLINSFVALEDKTFWNHHGFNVVRILGAIKESVFGGGQVSGTSTITQQLARNVYLTSDMSKHSMKRKIIEAWYTVQIEKDLSKKQIIEAYLNTINLGFGSYGVEAASNAYFNTNVQNLTLPQCVALASLPQAPTSFALVEFLDPTAKPSPKDILKQTSDGTYVVNDAGKERRETCLDLMKEQGYISKSQYDKVIKIPLKKILDVNFDANTSKYSYFTDYVVDQVIADLQKKKNLSYKEAWEQVYKGGLRIHSTMNKKAQLVIQKEFQNSANFPSITSIRYDANNNIINKDGRVAMYALKNYVSNQKFTFRNDEIKKNEDGSFTIKANKRLKIYKTSSNGQTDYTISFPTMYKWEKFKMYTISGGYMNIPQQYKVSDASGNIIVSADFVKTKEGKNFFEKKNGKYIVRRGNYVLNQKVIQPQAAMAMISNDTGELKAMVGGRKTKGKLLYNRAIQPRQTGSSIKPICVYGAALQQSVEEMRDGKKHNFVNYKIDRQGTFGWGNYITAGSIVYDERTTNNGQTWPYNAGGGYSGRNTFRSAIRNSINTCAYKIFMQVGADYSVKMAEKFGISTMVTTGRTNDLNAAALALGGQTKGVSPLEMANAFTTFPNNGYRAEKPICYTKVTDNNGKTIMTNEINKVKVLDEGVAWIMTDLMKGVVSGGTGTAARVYGVQAGGKTGTTSSQYDIWFDGFTPKYTAALWIGNDINISLTSMSGYAAALWGKIMNQIPSAAKGKYKEMPDDIDYIGGEYYVKGTHTYINYYPFKPKKKKVAPDAKNKSKSQDDNGEDDNDFVIGQ